MRQQVLQAGLIGDHGVRLSSTLALAATKPALRWHSCLL
jgi:hypothetical protein